MEHLKSAPASWVGEEHLGFVINAVFSQDNTRTITEWLDGLGSQTPEGVYPMTAEGLHITVLDWVAPLFDYGGADKQALYDSLKDDYTAAFRGITDAMEPFDVHFTELRVTPGTIILVGQDNGQFQSLRKQFMDSVTLPEGGKEPPSIIHSSIARFIAPVIDLTPIEEYAQSHPLDLTQRIDAFRLVETRREPMQDFMVLDTFNLTTKG
jgi:hypothetical protein